MTLKQSTKKVGSIGKTIMQSNAWKAIITGLCALILGFMVDKGKEIEAGVERSKDVPENTKRLEKHEKWFITRDSLKVIEQLKDELYKDSSRKNDKEMMKMLMKIYYKLDIIDEIVENKRLKKRMDSIPIIIISEPPSAEIQEPVYSKTLQERYPYATKWIMDSLLAGKK